MAFVAPIAATMAANAGTISTVLGVASAAVSGISAIQQGNYQAAVAKNNALIAEQNAASASEAAQVQQKRSDIDFAAMAAEQVAAQGASGLDTRSGSNRRAVGRTLRTRGEAARDIRAQGLNQIMGFQQDAANFRAEGRAAKRQGVMTAIGAGLGAAGSVMSKGSLLSRSGGRRPWDTKPNWYGRG